MLPAMSTGRTSAMIAEGLIPRIGRARGAAWIIAIREIGVAAAPSPCRNRR
jgi:hypothetical protein